MKKILSLLMMAGIFNLQAHWQPIFQYGIAPCQLNIFLFDASGNLVYTYLNAQTPLPGPFGCSSSTPPNYAIFNVTGGPTFRVNLNSSATVSLPCLGGLTHTFSFSMGTPGPICDTSYYVNY